MASVSDENYIVCAAGEGTLVLTFFPQGIQKLEGEAGHMLSVPTLELAHTFFMRHFDIISGNRLYDSTR